jgi:hypothetical protein
MQFPQVPDLLSQGAGKLAFLRDSAVDYQDDDISRRLRMLSPVWTQHSGLLAKFTVRDRKRDS